VSELYPIAVLISGEGTNLQALLDTVHARQAQVVAVASSSAAAKGLERARAHGVPAEVFPRSEFASRGERDQALASWLHERGARLVVLAGYMELLGEQFLADFPEGVINVHPSLLPAFPGLKAVEQALAYGVKVFGVTIHYVDTGMDTGPVILQGAVELPDARTEGEVMAGIRPLEHTLLSRAVVLAASGRLHPDEGNLRRIAIDPIEG
jgi:phosphoribosylglycinamide formyltransferase-1